MATNAARKLSLAILRIRNFRMLVFARMFTMMALQAQAIIVGWQIYSLTGDVFMLGLTGLAEAVPAITMAFFAGYVVDIGQPRRIYTACIGLLALNTFVLLAFAGGYVPIEKTPLLILMFSCIFMSGLIRAFNAPSAFTILAQTVRREDMPAAAAWLGSAFQTASITGPAVAGIIYGGYGPGGAWIMPAMLLTIGFFCATGIRLNKTVHAEKRESAVKSITAGWKFIISHKPLLSMMALDMFAVLFGGAVAMLPAFAEEILAVGAQGLGALRAAPAVGAIFTTLYLALNPMQRISAMRLLVVVAGFGASMIGFGLSSNFWLSMVFLAFSGVFDSISMTIRGTLMQLLTPDHMRGRVSSINSMFIISSNEIGAFESGTAARFFGLAPSVVLGGACTLLVVGVIAKVSPKFRKLVVDPNEKSGK